MSQLILLFFQSLIRRKGIRINLLISSLERVIATLIPILAKAENSGELEWLFSDDELAESGDFDVELESSENGLELEDSQSERELE